jgi:hypothetical protein
VAVRVPIVSCLLSPQAHAQVPIAPVELIILRFEVSLDISLEEIQNGSSLTQTLALEIRAFSLDKFLWEYVILCPLF